MQDYCTCHSLPHLESLPWSSNFSRTLKQLSISRCPKILCIHLQRASINQFGELVKLQGHVSFPLILNMLPFTMEKLQCQKPRPHSKYLNVQPDSRVLNCIYGQSAYSKIVPAPESRCNDQIEAFAGESSLPQPKGCVDDLGLEDNNEVSVSGTLVASEPLLYRLVSVVEHFGQTGGGHYTVYRSVISASPEEHTGENLNLSPHPWFCISDSDVHRVSEEDVLAAEASLLFYERIIGD